MQGPTYLIANSDSPHVSPLLIGIRSQHGPHPLSLYECTVCTPLCCEADLCSGLSRSSDVEFISAVTPVSAMVDEAVMHVDIGTHPL